MWRYLKYLAINLVITGVTPVLTIALFSAIGSGAATYVRLRELAQWKWLFLFAGGAFFLLLYLFDGVLGRAWIDRPLHDAASWPVMLPSRWARLVAGAAFVSVMIAMMLWVDRYVTTPLVLIMLTAPCALCLLALLKGDEERRRQAYLRSARTTRSLAGDTSPRTIERERSFGNHALLGISHSRTFDQAQACALGLNGLWTFFVWLVWTSDFGRGSAWDSGVQADLEAAGITDERFSPNKTRLQLLLWLSPLVSALVLWVFALITVFVAHLHRVLNKQGQADRAKEEAWTGDDTSAPREESLRKIGATEPDEGMVKLRSLLGMFKVLMCTAVLVFGCLWITASIVGASLRLANVVLGFVVGISSFLALYIYISLSDVDKAFVTKSFSANPLMVTGKAILNSDWSKAVLLMPFAFVCPFYLVLSGLNQTVRRCRGLLDRGGSHSWLTARTARQLGRLRDLKWTSVLRKMQLLCIAAVALQVLGGMGTNIALAWVNSWLDAAGVSFYSLAVIFLLVGLGMFMNPLVPGIAVYFFGGLVVPAAYMREHSISAEIADMGWDSINGTAFITAQRPEKAKDGAFWMGFLVTSGLNFFLKLLAITLQQKAIGEPMSTNVTVLVTCQVNKPFMRSVEMILRRPGLSFPKVMILCGGPDWPTSVLTGILRLNLGQMLLGSLPVVVQVITCTAAGAFRLREAESESWSALSGAALNVAMLWGVFLTVGAGYYIMDTWERHGEELSKPRKEHVALDWLDLVQQRQQARSESTAAWRNLPQSWRVATISGASVMLVSSYVMLVLNRMCWDDFQVTDPVDRLGMSFVKPLGWAAIAAFALATAQYQSFAWWLKCATRTREDDAEALERQRKEWISGRLKDIEDAAEPCEVVPLQQLENLVAEVKWLRARVPALEERVQALEAAQGELTSSLSARGRQGRWRRPAAGCDSSSQPLAQDDEPRAAGDTPNHGHRWRLASSCCPCGAAAVTSPAGLS